MNNQQISSFDLRETDLPTGETDYFAEVEALRVSKIGSVTDLVLRYATITIPSLALLAYTGDYIFLIWFIAYCIADFLLCWFLLKPKLPVGKDQCYKITAINFLSCVTFLSLPLYLWSQEEPFLRSIGLIALFGFTLFNISRHTRQNLVQITDTVFIVGSVLFAGFLEARQHVGETAYPDHALLIAITTITFALYLFVMQRSVLNSHKRLRKLQKEMIQTQKMKAMGQLTSGVAHDFNNLLTVIRGNIELSMIEENEKEKKEHLEGAQIAADRAASVTRQLLTFARRSDLKIEKIDLAEFVEYLSGIFARLLPETISLNISQDENLTQLNCDRTQLESGLINLVLNARDALSGTGAVLVSFEPEKRLSRFSFGGQLLPAGEFCKITVRDDGPGIPHPLIRQVIEPFFTTKAPGEGSGLGLSTVKGFAEQSQGGLEIESCENGTSVSLLLPVQKDQN